MSEQPEILLPSEKQIENCYRMDWFYLGDGIFEHQPTGQMGYFTRDGFQKED